MRDIEISRKSQQGEIDVKRDEFIIMRKDGKKRHVEFSVYDIPHKGKPTDLQVIQGVDITARKHAEKALPESEENYRELADIISDVFFVMDKDLRYTYWNKASEKLVGIKAKDAIGKTIFDIFPDREDTRKAISMYREVLKTQQSQNFINEYKLGGKTYFFKISAYPSMNGLSVFVKDITERKRVEKEMRDLQDRFDRIFNGMYEEVMMIGKDYKIKEVNEFFLKQYKLTREEVIGQTCYEVIHQSEHPCNEQGFLCPKKSIFESGEPVRLEHIHKDLKGKELVEELYAFPLFGPSGEVENIVEILHDITKRKKAKEELRESEEKYRSLFENLNDAAILIDTETGIILESNKQAEILLGRPREEIIGLHQTELHPSDKVEKCQQMFEDCIFLGYYKDSTAEVITKDDMNIPVAISAHKLTLGGKNLIICLLRDITDRKLAEEKEKLHQMQLIQTDKLVSLGEVVTGVAHEINNPNSFITYNVPLLKETWEMFEPILKEYAVAHPEWRKNDIGFEEFIQDMNEIIYSIGIGSERINKIVASLKDFARVDEAGHKKLVNINEIIKKTIIIVDTQMRKSVGHININLADNLPKIQGHFQKLEQVVTNLVVNSVQSISNKEKGKLSISTRYIDRLLSVLIEIEDNGKGIEPNLLNRIFEPFFTTRRREGGTGLGLSVSYRIVQEHNGTISVLSKPGVGTRFTVFLPVKIDVKYDLKPLILCVNDDETVLNIFKKYSLRIENMIFDTTCQSAKVLEYIDKHPEVDIIISDIKMPVVNGWEILQKVKEKYPLLTVILYSDYPDEIQKKDGIDAKPDYLIEKPIEFKRLELILKSIIRQKL